MKRKILVEENGDEKKARILNGAHSSSPEGQSASPAPVFRILIH
jgi:hypothetical protein